MSDFPEVTEGQWRERVERELGGEGLESLRTRLLDGVELEPLYTGSPGPARSEAVRREHRAGARAWQRCQRIDAHELDAAAAGIAGERQNGADAIWLRLDRAHRLGQELDGDLPLADLGHDALILVDADDLAELLRAAAPGPLGLYLDAGGNAIPAAALLMAALEESELQATDLRLRLGIDPLGALLRDGELPDAPAALTAEAGQLIETIGSDVQRCRAMTVSLLPYARAGASAVQQLGAMLGTTVQYLRWLELTGIDPDVAIRQIDFVLPMEGDFLLGVAKVRAARLLWAKLLAGLESHACAPWIHAVSAERTFTARDPWSNMLRGTVQTAAAVIGGADEISTTPFDLRLGRSDALGRRIARNTQAILDEESALAATLDPAAGAHAVESLTDTLARRAWEVFHEIERGGGMFTAIDNGRLLDAIARRTHERSVRLADGDDAIVGVTHFPPGDASQIGRDRGLPDEALQAARRRQAERAGRRGAPLLEALRATAYDREAIAGARVRAAIDAAGAGATVAELSDALRPAAAYEHAGVLRPRSDERIWEASHRGGAS